MRKIVKSCMTVYNFLALPFVPLTIYAFAPEGTMLSKFSGFFTGWFTLVAAGLTLPIQNFLIPQIIAVVLIGLYLYDILRNRHFYPIAREMPVFCGLSFWTALSAACILLGCLALGDGGGEPLPYAL